MRIDEPLTGIEVRENAIYFENLIDKMKHLFHKHEADHKHLPHAIEIEHLKNLVSSIEEKLSDETSKEDIEKIVELKNKITSKINDDSPFTAEVYDVDSVLNKKPHDKDNDFINNLEEVYDIDAFHEKNPTFRPKGSEIKNPEIAKLKEDLKEIHIKLENKLEKKLKR